MRCRQLNTQWLERGIAPKLPQREVATSRGPHSTAPIAPHLSIPPTWCGFVCLTTPSWRWQYTFRTASRYTPLALYPQLLGKVRKPQSDLVSAVREHRMSKAIELGMAPQASPAFFDRHHELVRPRGGLRSVCTP